MKLHTTEDVTYKNILALHLLAYQFECTCDSQNRKLSKVEIADCFIQIRDVSFSFILYVYNFKI